MTKQALVALLLASAAACTASSNPPQRPPAAAPPISASSIPAGTLDTERAMQLPDQQPVRLTAWLLAPGYDCPPCPAGAACEPCRSPYPEFAAQPGASAPAFRAIVELDLTQADVGQQFFLEGRFSGVQDDLRMLVAQRIQRIVR